MKKLIFLALVIGVVFYLLHRSSADLPTASAQAPAASQPAAVEPAATPGPAVATAPAAAAAKPMACLVSSRVTHNGVLLQGGRTCYRNRSRTPEAFTQQCGAEADAARKVPEAEVELSPLNDCPVGELGSCELAERTMFVYDGEGLEYEQRRAASQETPAAAEKLCRTVFRGQAWNPPRAGAATP